MSQTPGPQNPYASTLNSGGGSDLTRVFEPLRQRTGMMKLIAVLVIIPGALYCITIIGAVIGIPFIMMGLALMKSANLIEEGSGGNPQAFSEATSQLAKFFFISGILAIIGIVINVAFLALSVMGAVLG